MSRIGIDIPVFELQNNQQVNGAPSYPPFKLMLGGDAPVDQLETWWQQVLQGQVSTRDVTIRLQVLEGGKSFTDASIIDVQEALIVGFSNGAVTPASITLRPDYMRTHPASTAIAVSSYALIDAPVLASPTIEFEDQVNFAGLNRISGGETQVALQSVGETRVPVIVQSVTDLKFTAVARTPSQLKGNVDFDVFTPFYAWIDGIVLGNALSGRTLLVKQREMSNGAVIGTTVYEDCLPVKINFVNPALVEAGVAPWVFDFTVRPQLAFVP